MVVENAIFGVLYLPSLSVNLPEWLVHVLGSHTMSTCVYLVSVGGTEPWPLPVFFKLRKYAFGQMWNTAPLNRLEANRYKASTFHRSTT